MVVSFALHLDQASVDAERTKRAIATYQNLSALEQAFVAAPPGAKPPPLAPITHLTAPTIHAGGKPTKSIRVEHMSSEMRSTMGGPSGCVVVDLPQAEPDNRPIPPGDAGVCTPLPAFTDAAALLGALPAQGLARSVAIRLSTSLGQLTAEAVRAHAVRLVQMRKARVAIGVVGLLGAGVLLL